MATRVSYSVPMLRVIDVERSIHFYELLGFTVTGMLRDESGTTRILWANLSCHRGNPEERTTENESAAVMLTLGQGGGSDLPLGAKLDPTKQGASLYMFTQDIEGLRADLVRNGIEVTEIVPRPYMEKGEMELRDPDGWRVFVGGV